MVVQKLPMSWLQSHMSDVVKAALAVLKHLPSHASLEHAQLLKSLTTVMHLVIPQVSPTQLRESSLESRKELKNCPTAWHVTHSCH